MSDIACPTCFGYGCARCELEGRIHVPEPDERDKEQPMPRSKREDDFAANAYTAGSLDAGEMMARFKTWLKSQGEKPRTNT